MNDTKDMNEQLEAILKKLDEAENEFAGKWANADLDRLIREQNKDGKKQTETGHGPFLYAYNRDIPGIGVVKYIHEKISDYTAVTAYCGDACHGTCD